MTVTVVIPALNEAGNVGRLIDETFRVLPQNILSEMIVIDDGSSDRTGDEIKSLISIHPRLRYIRHSIRTGQSAAIRTGVLAARSPIIATMDGDGQNDPADIPKLLGRLKAPGHTGPALCFSFTGRVEFVPVNDRPRLAGKSKYTNFSRFFLGLYDMIGILWLRRRTRLPAISEGHAGRRPFAGRRA